MDNIKLAVDYWQGKETAMDPAAIKGDLTLARQVLERKFSPLRKAKSLTP